MQKSKTLERRRPRLRRSCGTGTLACGLSVVRHRLATNKIRKYPITTFLRCNKKICDPLPDIRDGTMNAQFQSPPPNDAPSRAERKKLPAVFTTLNASARDLPRCCKRRHDMLRALLSFNTARSADAARRPAAQGSFLFCSSVETVCSGTIFIPRWLGQRFCLLRATWLTCRALW